MRYFIILLLTGITAIGFSQPAKISDTPAHLEWVAQNGKWGLYDFQKQQFIIQPKYEEGAFYDRSLSVVKSNGKYGLISHDGTELTAMSFDTTINFSQNIIVAKEEKKFKLILKESLLSENLGFANRYTRGREYDQVIVSYSDDYALVELDGKFGYINDEGKEVIALKYDAATLFEEGVATVSKRGKWGAIDKQENVVIEFQYALMSSFFEGTAIALNKRTKWGMVDKDGEELIKFKYQFLTPMNDQGVLLAKKKGKYGLLDSEGNELVPFDYDFNEDYSGIMQVCEGYVWLIKDGKWGTIDYTGKTIIPFQYDDLYSTDGEEARVFLGKKMQVIAPTGECLENCDESR